MSDRELTPAELGGEPLTREEAMRMLHAGPKEEAAGMKRCVCGKEYPDIWLPDLCPWCWASRHRSEYELLNPPWRQPTSTREATDAASARGEGFKADAGKDRWDLLPWAAVRDIVKVLTFGAKEYAPNNWQKVSDGRDRYFAAAHRHIEAWWNGQRLDPKSGLPHLAHAACCLLFLAWFDGKEAPCAR